jgi:hypothetical protein
MRPLIIRTARCVRPGDRVIAYGQGGLFLRTVETVTPHPGRALLGYDDEHEDDEMPGSTLLLIAEAE